MLLELKKGISGNYLGVIEDYSKILSVFPTDHLEFIFLTLSTVSCLQTKYLELLKTSCFFSNYIFKYYSYFFHLSLRENSIDRSF